jgi:AcrR family transcriptional regulator
LADNDRRVRRTRQILHDALTSLILEKGYERLTVQDILDRADVGRSTFYSHFRDKEALLLSCFDGLREELRREFAAGGPSPAAIVFDHAHRHRRVYKALCGKQGGNVVHRHLHRLIGEAMRDHPLGRPEGVPAEVVTEFYASATVGLLIWWVDRDFRFGPERMAAMHHRLAIEGIGQSFLRIT